MAHSQANVKNFQTFPPANCSVIYSLQTGCSISDRLGAGSWRARSFHLRQFIRLGQQLLLFGQQLAFGAGNLQIGRGLAAFSGRGKAGGRSKARRKSL